MSARDQDDLAVTRALARQIAREDEAARLHLEDEARIQAWKSVDHPRCVECGRLTSERHEIDCLRVA